MPNGSSLEPCGGEFIGPAPPRRLLAGWQAFLRTAGVAEAPQNLVVVLEELQGFLLPVLLTFSQGQPMHGTWRAPGPWTDQGNGS